MSKTFFQGVEKFSRGASLPWLQAWQVPITSIQHLLVAYKYEEASSYSILIKGNFYNFTLWITPALDAWAVAQSHRYAGLWWA